jgi:hypothetical protein
MLQLGQRLAAQPDMPRVVAEANVGPLPLVRAGHRVYWVDPVGAFVPGLGHWSQLVRYLDLATGKIGVAGPGQTVFLSADGRYLLMSQTATSMTQTPVTGGTPQSRQSAGPGGTVIGLWNPAGHRVTVIGRAGGVIGAYTPLGSGHTLLAWLPADCGDCPVEITDTATMAVRSVRSPLSGGYALGGTFSPDGSRLALFVRLNHSDAARLALVNLATATVTLAREPHLALGTDIGWARWLPDGRRLVMGPATTGGYLVDTLTLSAEPLIVARGHGSQDPNFTIVLAPPSP